MDLTSYLRQDRRVKFDSAKAEKAVVARAEQENEDLNPADKNSILDAAADYATRDIGLAAVNAVREWAETDDLDTSETAADRLIALFIGIADEDKDGEITPEEQDLLEIALEAAYDYLLNLGVPEDDVSALLNEFEPEVADRVLELVISSLPEGDAADADVDSYVFGEDEDEGAALDAVYKKKLVVRNGKKVRINKRVSGTVRLSAKQKVAIKKARLKSHNARAMLKRAKSMRKRKQMGL